MSDSSNTQNQGSNAGMWGGIAQAASGIFATASNFHPGVRDSNVAIAEANARAAEAQAQAAAASRPKDSSKTVIIVAVVIVVVIVIALFSKPKS